MNSGRCSHSFQIATDAATHEQSEESSRKDNPRTASDQIPSFDQNNHVAQTVHRKDANREPPSPTPAEQQTLGGAYCQDSKTYKWASKRSSHRLECCVCG